MDKASPSFQSSLTGAGKEVKRSRIICLASQSAPDSFASLRPKDQRMLEESGEKNRFLSPYFTIIRVNISKIQVNLSIVNKEANLVAHLTPKASQFTYELQDPTQWCSETPKKMAAPIFHVLRLGNSYVFHLDKWLCAI